MPVVCSKCREGGLKLLASSIELFNARNPWRWKNILIFAPAT